MKLLSAILVLHLGGGEGTFEMMYILVLQTKEHSKIVNTQSEQ